MTLLTLDSVDLDRIAGSGQCFRWQRVADGRYAIPLHGAVFTVRQAGERAVLIESDWEDKRAEAAMRAYFDAACDYAAILDAVPRTDGALLSAARFGRGMRILRQPLWETLVSFILSQNNNIPRIRGLVERLCGGALAPFPGPEAVARLGEGGLRALGAGYRAPYVAGAAERFARGEGSALETMDYPAAREALKAYKGVGGKVADCVCLYALGHKRAFPVDVWMRRALEAYYPGGFPLAGSPYAGVYQQLLFYREREESARRETKAIE